MSLTSDHKKLVKSTLELEERMFTTTESIIRALQAEQEARKLTLERLREEDKFGTEH